MISLTAKYNTAAPRYTSYPTVPYWDKNPPRQQDWKTLVKKAFAENGNNISLYIHLPFCESLCTYCGCNTRITVNHAVETPYLDALLKEWRMYLDLFGTAPKLQQIHLGGGTPTFFSPQNLAAFIRKILADTLPANDIEFSFEAHPANTTTEHLQLLYLLGFRRISLGIQDFDPKVQQIINRVQTFEQVKKITQKARETGYTSVNYDLIYGLPLQNATGMQNTIEKVLQLRPDRIAFYSYAHVPWIKPGQRMFTEADLPQGETKRNLYELGRKAFEKAGYAEIGFDHFALPHDTLFNAEKKHTLNRNFMGYTTAQNKLLIGLGVSSISDAWNIFVQNEKKVEDYYARLDKNEFPFFKGHILTPEDLELRHHILQLMCAQQTQWNQTNVSPTLEKVHERLHEMEKDGLVHLSTNTVKVTPAGKPFLRNICMAFDARLWQDQPQSRIFSTTV